MGIPNSATGKDFIQLKYHSQSGVKCRHHPKITQFPPFSPAGNTHVLYQWLGPARRGDPVIAWLHTPMTLPTTTTRVGAAAHLRAETNHIGSSPQQGTNQSTRVTTNPLCSGHQAPIACPPSRLPQYPAAGRKFCEQTWHGNSCESYNCSL